MSASQVSFSVRAETRSETGKGIARKARQSGKIPAIVYRGGNMPSNVYLDQTEVLSGLRKNVSRNVLIGVEGIRADQITCLVREVQRHPVSHDIEHIDLYEVADGDSTVVEVPFVTVGKSMGVKAGGLLRQLVRSVKVKCSPLAIPAAIEYDITNLDIGEFIKASNLTAPADTQILFARDFNVLTVEGKKISKEEAAKAAADAAEAVKAKGKAAKPAAKPAAAAAKPATPAKK